MGERVSNMTLLSSGEPIDPKKDYVVAGWASVNPDADGPPIYDLVKRHIKKKKVITNIGNSAIKVRGA